MLRLVMQPQTAVTWVVPRAVPLEPWAGARAGLGAAAKDAGVGGLVDGGGARAAADADAAGMAGALAAAWVAAIVWVPSTSRSRLPSRLAIWEAATLWEIGTSLASRLRRLDALQSAEWPH